MTKTDVGWREAAMASLVGKREKVRVDLSKNKDVARHAPSQPADPDVAGVVVPMDTPMYVKLHRLMQSRKVRGGKEVRGLVGHTLEVDVFTHGVTVYVRYGMLDGKLKVMVKDDDGLKTLAEYSK